MEERLRRYRQRQTSPERTKVWTEKSPKYHQIRKVPVVYYLCKHRHLEHPHFIEVPMSSPEGLYLRDVVNRLDDLRGKGLHLKYSWSSKRSYKTGYVWHDLSEDDLIIPVNGHEYILKGSELFENNDSGCVGPVGSVTVQDIKQLPEPESAKSRDDSSSSSSRNVKGDKAFQEDEYYLSDQHPDSGGMSSESRLDGTSGSGDALILVGSKDGKTRNVADASTQTDETSVVPRGEDISTEGSSEDALGCSKRDSSKILQNCIALERQNSGASSGHGLVPSSPSSKSSARRKNIVAEFLNKADAKMINSFRIPEIDSPRPSRLQARILEEDVEMSPSARLKVTDMLIQLISCGSIPVKGHSFGLSHTNKPRFANLNSPCPWYSNSIRPEEFNCVSDNTRLMGMRVEDKERLSGSMSERKMLNKGDGGACLKNSPINSGRRSRQLDPVERKNETSSKQMSSISESMRSALSVRSRISLDKDDTSPKTPSASNNSSKRITYSPATKSPSQLHSSDEHNDVITTEERLASGARVIIHSRASLDTTD
uniref:SOSEKI DIX-like domain-containing protein n=1 Tax=Kalanchoe fedtschenkoi TaxID=63787 RepID=A0A7N0RD70_KALFE